MPAMFNYDGAHDGNNPPAGIIKGKLEGTAGQYEVRFRVINKEGIFAGPVDVTLNGAAAGVEAPVAACSSATPPSGLQEAHLIAEHRPKGSGNWEQEADRPVRYRCS